MLSVIARLVATLAVTAAWRVIGGAVDARHDTSLDHAAGVVGLRRRPLETNAALRSRIVNVASGRTRPACSPLN
jgi:hypothetical protein